MTKCEVIDLTPSDSGSDSDFIEATCHFCTFLYQVSVHQVSFTSSSCYSRNYFTGLMRVVESREVRQTHLHCEKLRVSLRDVNLSENETIYWL